MSNDPLLSSNRILNLAFDREDNSIVCQIGSGSITLNPGDIQLGAVELKDADNDYRATIDVTGRLSVISDHKSAIGGEPQHITVTGIPTLLIASNASRKKYFIQNLSEDWDIFLGGAAVSANSGMLAPAFGGFGDGMPYCGTEAIYGISPSGSVNVVVKEWV